LLPEGTHAATNVDRFQTRADHVACQSQEAPGHPAGGVLSAEEKGEELVLRPAIVLEMETYTDADIRRWDEEDRLSPGERARILKRLGAAG
jgi:hypothetical protein